MRRSKKRPFFETAATRFDRLHVSTQMRGANLTLVTSPDCPNGRPLTCVGETPMQVSELSQSAAASCPPYSNLACQRRVTHRRHVETVRDPSATALLTPFELPTLLRFASNLCGYSFNGGFLRANCQLRKLTEMMKTMLQTTSEGREIILYHSFGAAFLGASVASIAPRSLREGNEM